MSGIWLEKYRILLSSIHKWSNRLKQVWSLFTSYIKFWKSIYWQLTSCVKSQISSTLFLHFPTQNSYQRWKEFKIGFSFTWEVKIQELFIFFCKKCILYCVVWKGLPLFNKYHLCTKWILIILIQVTFIKFRIIDMKGIILDFCFVVTWKN